MPIMTIHLPEDLESYVLGEVQKGRFASPDEAITEAVRLLRQEKQEARGTAATPDEINRRLLEAGLLSNIPARPDPATYREFEPIAVEGEPVSETIIRERR
jgi:putative addiction module CopG family antidote